MEAIALPLGFQDLTTVSEAVQSGTGETFAAELAEIDSLAGQDNERSTASAMESILVGNSRHLATLSKNKGSSLTLYCLNLAALPNVDR